MNGVVARWIAVAVLGTVILGTGMAANINWLSPGPLTTAHRFTDGCTSCHANVKEGNFGWLHGLVSASDGKQDSAGCLSCHKIGDETAEAISPTIFQPHGLSVERLRNVGTDQVRRQKEFFAPPTKASVVDELRAYSKESLGGGLDTVFCATCHKEHKGQEGKAFAATNERCQTCHQQKFDQFDTDHQAFASYPFKRRTRIIFDHARHFGTHFKEFKLKRPDANFIPDTCASCHSSGKDKQHMGLKPFDDTCSSCHLPQIVGTERATGPKGLAFLTLPGLDTQSLIERNAPIGEWPDTSDAELTPLMQLLLTGTPEREALLSATRDLDLQDLSGASEEQIAAVTELVWEIKRLYYDLSTSKASIILERIGHDDRSTLRKKQIVNLLATMPRDVLVNAQREWLPKLASEIAGRNDPDWQTKLIAAAQQTADTGDAENDADKAESSGTPENAEVKDETPAAPPNKLVTKADKGRWYVNVLGEIIQEGDESEDAKQAAKGEVDGSAPPPTPVADAKDAASEGSPPSPDAEVTLDESTAPVVDEESWNDLGGWYRKDYAILFKPTGHKDAFLKAWFDFAGQRTDTTVSPEKQATAIAVFDLLSDKNTQGQCTKCHSIDASQNSGRAVQWTPSRFANKASRFTKFTHEPHFSLLDDRGCLTCHTMNAPKDLKASYKGTDPFKFQSNFKPIEKDLCATCHKAQAARQDCQLCHTYHVSPVSTPMTNTRLPAQAKKKKKN